MAKPSSKLPKPERWYRGADIQHLPPASRRAAAAAMLRQWAHDDEALTDEQLAANADLLRDLDASRSSSRLLFPDLRAEDKR